MSDGTILRNAGSAQDTPGVRVSYGVQMFTGLGNSKLCDACGNAHSLGTGWTKYGPGRILWRCPRCSIERAARKAGGGA